MASWVSMGKENAFESKWEVPGAAKEEIGLSLD
jgi:hypothetical protein